ncbi:uncharacterized protein LOC126845142 [Adelges cooleyi]|uniref:uncharacterized protein LOC126845142 n=1 Tax=Adelges cooleyi TaxID=133065 RepID=UPI0021802B72|nr:uncharacterized protein LOC126845142 [Adelges cooleyi]
MKLYCVLFSFAIANILAETIDNYKMEVVITNELIRQADKVRGGVTNAIRTIFYENTQYSMGYTMDQAATNVENISSIKSVPAAETLVREISKADLKVDSMTRRDMVKVYIRNLIKFPSGGHYKFNSLENCILIGLYITSLLQEHQAHKFMKSASVDTNDNCTLTSAQGDFTFYATNTMIGVYQYWPDSHKKILLDNIEL